MINLNTIHFFKFDLDKKYNKNEINVKIKK